MRGELEEQKWEERRRGGEETCDEEKKGQCEREDTFIHMHTH